MDLFISMHGYQFGRKNEGFDNGSEARSSLFWEMQRLLEVAEANDDPPKDVYKKVKYLDSYFGQTFR